MSDPSGAPQPGGPRPPGPPPGGQPTTGQPIAGQPMAGQATAGTAMPPPQPGQAVPQPQGFLHTNNAPNPNAYRPPMQRTAVQVGAPIAVLIVLGVAVVIWFGFFSLVSLTGTILGLVLASLSLGTVVVLYMLLDRWEPEPPRLLIFAFLWGAGLATTVAYFFNTAFGAIFGQGASAVVSAPFIEEIGKGSFLLLMLTGRRRKEMNSLTDCLIYAGMAAVGFAWLEDVLYLIQNPDAFGSVAVLRLVFSPFAHPLFTSVTAIGVFYSMRQRSTGGKVGLIIAGFLGAMLLHAAWNGSTAFGDGMGFIIGYFLVGVPLFAGAVVLAIMSRRRERQLVAKHLPRLAQDGIITWGHAATFATMAHRKQARQQVAASGGPAAVTAFKQLVDATTELAFVRDRFDRGLADQRMYQLHQDLAATCQHVRAQTPALDRISALPSAVGPGGPMLQHPGPQHPGQGNLPGQPPQPGQAPPQGWQ